MTSNLIGRFAGSVEQATRDTYGNEPLTRYNGDLVIPEETSYEIVVLKGIAVHFVMAPGEREPMHGEEQRIVGDLVDVFMADNPKPSSALENVFLDDWREAGSDGERLRVAIDQVASLTDTSALTLHSLLC
ncbi:deoxyguanosinetriphosphate triphosphohydrolase-like protein [Bifidobacterium adolescentis]|nr:deoxyguanosinetriphosphate triphosphohydrolase-like protein [Bifidobacterium adolescentis]